MLLDIAPLRTRPRQAFSVNIAARLAQLTRCRSRSLQLETDREQPEVHQLIADNLWLFVLDVIDRAHDVADVAL